MIRRLLLTSFAIALFATVPAYVGATESMAVEEMAYQMEQEVTISYSEGVLYVSGAEGQTLEVVSLTGKKVMQQKIDSPAQKIELNIPKGCYIVKVGNVVRKISVK